MTSDESNPRSRQIDAAIAEHLEALERGTPLAREAFLAQHADIADELREFLANETRFQRRRPPLGVPRDETTDLSGAQRICGIQ